MLYAAMVAAIRKGDIRPAYLLCGAQPFMIDAVIGALRAAVDADRHGGFACETFHGSETTGEKVRSAAREVPMLVPRRLVVVRELDALVKRSADLDALLAYLDRPSPTTILAMTAEAFDLRTRLARRVEEIGAVLRVEKVTSANLSRFVVQHAGALGGSISAGGAAALAELVGDDLAVVHDSLCKLVLYVGEGRTIEAADVAAVIAPSRQHGVFELVDAFARRDAGAALALCTSLLEQGEAPLRLLALLARQIRLIAYAKTDADHPRLASLHPFVRRKTTEQADRFTLRGLVRAVAAVHEADVALKSSRRKPERIFEWLVIEVARAGGPPTRRRSNTRGSSRGNRPG